ncbi:tyrosine-type recombinase/integrase [Rhizobium ruizarguesonis]|uniref:tyrosine-type recombinase/integrase n=1 Tax=Rhizobium ruizarguesonis TaxID=2081791 RepID=UPI001030AA8D|nr:integrase arm-type DNA-binding domain-containing protein [Rhizobium ruizarguesonis]TBB03883.1 DUF4102 domain-containing protein [Rhizobium ruizarguesonis]
MAKSLTVKQIEALKNPSRRVELPDGITVGLYLVVQPSGRKSWAVRFRARGKTKKLTLGTYPHITLSAAREMARAALTSVAEGKDPSKKADPSDRAAMTVAYAVDDFLKRYVAAHNRSSTARETSRLLQKELVVPFGDRNLTSLTRRDVADRLDNIVDRGAQIGANRTLAAMRRFFNWCIERDYLQTSPCGRIKAPAVERSRERVLADREISLIWEASSRIGWPFGHFIKLLILTAQRRSEVAGMRRIEVDWAARLWKIPAERSKNLQPHEVPLSEISAALLRSAPVVDGDAGLVFTTTGRSVISGYSKAKWRVDQEILALLKERAEAVDVKPLPNWTFHDLRRTAATGMARAGVAQQVIEKVLNHTSGSLSGVAGIYNRHAFTAEKREALELWSKCILGLTDPVAAAGEEGKG